MNGTFPQHVEEIPSDQLFVETFGWQPATWGAFLVAEAGLLAADLWRSLGALAAFLCALAGLAGVLLVAYEIRRRRQPSVLWATGDVVAVYRKGVFDMSMGWRDLTFYQLSIVNTAYILVGFGLMAFLLGAVAWTGPRHKDQALIGAAAAAFLSSFVSFVWTRLFCYEFRVSTKSFWIKSVLLRRSSGARLLR